LPHGQKTCSAPNRLGCHRNIPDGHSGWESLGIHLANRIFLDPTRHKTIGAIKYNHTNSRHNNNSRCTHQHSNNLAYRNNTLIIVTLIAQPTRTYHTFRITMRMSSNNITRLHNSNSYNIYKISYPRSCKRSSSSRQHICSHNRVRCSRSIPRPLLN
jgi:hypothetical protein